ncbi:MAG: phage holin family protein [Pseudomonas sp.]|uniref:phage holin family protein n=1 Tax=Pseudomonas sp. TaxID=306 RepID=UPI00339641AD
MNNQGLPDEQLYQEPEPSLVGLLRQLTREVPALFTQELALAKSEISDALNATKAGVEKMAMGGAVMLAGFLVLLLSAVYGLSLYMQPWLAAFIVGAVVMIIGFVMVQAGEKTMERSSFTPERTLHSLNKDKDMITRRVP